MLIKELQKAVNIAWSPSRLTPVFLAAGTAAQQFDSNGGSALEIYSTNLHDSGYDLELMGCLTSQYRFQKLIWSPASHSNENGRGILVGACEGGNIMIYSASKILAGENGLIARQGKHTGTVTGLDYNPFQPNLLASAASESEIFIWDINNMSSHMTPGAKTQPFEDVQNIGWNRQVQHIVASVFSTRCIIWDLRKSEQIIKLSDIQSRVRWHAIQWHPDVATQMWLASEEDEAPVVQLWDLRYATSPSKSIRIHQRGVLGMAWCPQDSNLMVTCGKDNHIYCWNPNTDIPEGEILSEIATTATWCSNVQWCPRNPALIASSSLDGNVSIYSLFGGTQQQLQTSKKIADSFPDMDQYGYGVPISRHSAQIVYNDLKRAPQWLKRKCGISFGFGGSLVDFNSKSNGIRIFQVITEPELVKRASNFESFLSESNFMEYCRQRADQISDKNGRTLWYFIKANFDSNPTDELLNLLGYNKEDMQNTFDNYITEAQTYNIATDSKSTLSTDETSHNIKTCVEDTVKTPLDADNKAKTFFKIPSGVHSESLISKALLIGNLEMAVELCMQSNRPTEALIIASRCDIELLTRTQNRYLKKKSDELLPVITGLVSRDWIDFVTNCTLDSWKEALVAALKHGEENCANICEKLGDRLICDLRCFENVHNAMICYICAGCITKLVAAWYKLKQSQQKTSLFRLTSGDLQELAEIVIILKKSKNSITSTMNGMFADFLIEYIRILASQGALTFALTYMLALEPQDNLDLDELRHRIYYTINVKLESNKVQREQNLYNLSKQLPSNLTPLSQSLLNYPKLCNTNSFQNQIETHSWKSEKAIVPSTPSFTKLNSTPPNHPQVNKVINNPENSASSQSGGVNSRAKYIVDPSVAATSSTRNLCSYALGASTPLPLSSIKPATLLNTYNSTTIVQPSEFAPIEHSQLSQMLPLNIDRNATPPPGWNDPPVLKSKVVKNAEASLCAPITHPLFGTDQNQNVDVYSKAYVSYPPPPLTNSIFCSMPQSKMTPSSQLIPLSQKNNNSPQYHHKNSQTEEILAQQQKWNSIVSQVEYTERNEPTPKISLPEEYSFLQTVFEGLKTHCLSATSDPRTQRKLVGVEKRLENLYDCLRNARLTSTTVAALHEIVQFIQIGDYGNALKIYTSIAFGSDFSQCAGFMSGLKVLIQSAADLHVLLKE